MTVAKAALGRNPAFFASTGARRHEKTDGEPDDRGLERVAEARRTDRSEKGLPSPGPQCLGDERHVDGGNQEKWVRRARLGPDLGEIGVAKEKRQEGDSHRDNKDGSNP